MKLAYLGRFAEGWATERDLATAFGRLGIDVVQFNEADPATWAMLASPVARRPFDLVVWTPATLSEHSGQVAALNACRGELPVVGYHLDRWWGLRRARDLRCSAFLRCAMLVTADGGHEDQWCSLRVRHHWLPPAIAAEEAALIGERRRELACDVAFVGNWRRYHPEWPHRRQLVAHLREWFGDRFGLWPDHLGPVRGQRLADLYVSARVVVGDSCLAGGGHYWSDRVPETLGRGGFLLHPEVDGLAEHFKAGDHLATWPAGDWHALRDALTSWLDDDEARTRIAAAGRRHVLEHHTYDVRAMQVLALARREDLL